MIKEIKAGNLTAKVYETRAELGRCAAFEAAEAMRGVIADRGECNAVFAAAPSQNEFLEALVNDGAVDFSKINAFNMDEYIGLPDDAPQGFGNFLRERLFGKVNFKSVNCLNGNSDPETECARYSELLRGNPPDIVCMGIGENGHIAFNDPPVADFNDTKMVKAVELDQACRRQQVNDGCFAEIGEVPSRALTLTVPALVSTKHIFCMVPAAAKAEAVFNAINGKAGEWCPATILRAHKNAVMYIDKDSGKRVL
jgi:glucosamine-6-phosphate deaminase